ncbi:AEL285Wp [Eremothecium gossypii ATCC 10895]|uniref:AEL285Wp n=1 Tax=Eremothecium gossypii (strain ATCC 10895 / CBS 109.51 / FGSC 9923 / NRRL Y-1056) TaxID=284811 RepID=Q758P0_EREGS|nr:AEL285Wp [Eremothecium gossypii ATCC 10895]AAS52399.1 AEL285Wp [Eremothecium gossypii ATCC 10895]AEY96697.1 FAEL285Wp [Eremothecium gossypii FDAG1]
METPAGDAHGKGCGGSNERLCPSLAGRFRRAGQEPWERANPYTSQAGSYIEYWTQGRSQHRADETKRRRLDMLNRVVLQRQMLGPLRGHWRSMGGGPSAEELRRRANMGEMLTYLQEKVPLLLSETIEDARLAPDVVLRLMPLSRPYLPEFHGHAQYKTVWKGLQMVVNTFVVRQPCAIGVRNLHVDEANRLIRISWATTEGPEGEAAPSAQAGGTDHEELRRHLGHRLDEQWVRSLARGTHVKTRVVSGVFLFELDPTNERICSHIVDNVTMIDETEEDQGAKKGAFAV